MACKSEQSQQGKEKKRKKKEEAMTTQRNMDDRESANVVRLERTLQALLVARAAERGMARNER